MTNQLPAQFKKNSKSALADPVLQEALQNLKKGFVTKRAKALENFPEFEQFRVRAEQLKNETLHYLDFYLEEFETKVLQSGGNVHWALDAKEANEIAINIARSVNAKLITKGKSMVAEEIGLNAALTQAGFTVVETDLGEYIIQLRNEAPSHIVAPAIHVLKSQVAENFISAHKNLPKTRDLHDPQNILEEARAVLREKFLTADVGITGANFLVAENGTTVIVTNEGNGDLTQTSAKVHIVIASIEKIVPTINDALTLLRLLTRSATGQEITSYVTFSIGPKRYVDLDGPKEFHVILVDNGRSSMLNSIYQDMLRCIRCGACLNHCPVYAAIGGQAYGSIYPGPMGAVLTPSLFGIKNALDLPNASTFCGRCEDVCPMRIPLPKMLRAYREEEFTKKLAPITVRSGLKFWAYLAKRPRIYHLIIKIVAFFLNKLGKKINLLPFASGWTKYRDFPIPQGKTFHEMLREKKYE